MHRVSLSPVSYKGFSVHFFIFWQVEIDQSVSLPRTPLFLILQVLCTRNAGKVKAEMLLLSQGESMTRDLLLLCPSLCWAITFPLGYLGVSITPITKIFGCCPEQLFEAHYEDAVCRYPFVLFP